MIVKKYISWLIVFLLVFQCVTVNIAEAVEMESVQVQMYNGNISNSTNTINPYFKITNKGTTTLSLSDIKVRYYFTADNNKAQNFYCDHSSLTDGYDYTGLTPKVTGTIKIMEKPFADADSYLEIGFINTALNFSPNQVVDIQFRMAKADWSNYIQSNDFSFNSTGKTYSDFENIAVFSGGKLIFGKLPGSSERSITATITGSISGNGNIINVPIGTKVSTLINGLTVSSGASYHMLEGSSGNVVSSPDTTDVTSAMMVKVVAENFESTEYSITLAPTPMVRLTTPSGITWDSTIPGKAKWNAVSNASSYNVQLKKNEVNKGSVVTSTGLEYDFTNDIISSGNGTYIFTVTAIGDKINFTDSDESSDSSGYTYTVPLSESFKLTTPSGITWDSTIPGKAKWNAVSNASSYNVQLKKNEVNKGSVVTSTGLEYDFTNDIVSYGNGAYTFIVMAIGDKLNFTDSDESSDSSVYTYTIPLSSACDVVGLISPLGGTISGSAIYASVPNETESQLINVIISNDATWKMYSDLECTDANEIKNNTMALSVGDNIAYIKTTAQNLTTFKVYMVKIIREENTNAGNTNAGNSLSGSIKQGSAIIVNGKHQIAAKAIATTTKGGRSVMTVTIDTNSLKKILESEGNGATVTIHVTNGSDVALAVLSGQLIKSMEKVNAVVEIKTESATYTIPVDQININSVLEQMGTNVEPEDVKVEIEIAEPTQKSVKLVENSAEKEKFTIVIKPIEFNLRCIYGHKTIDVSKFNSYVERTVAIPEGLDLGKITTGVIIEADGTVRHVPTKIIAIDGKYYAKINSLTNSIYALVWNPVKLDDVVNHWAKDAINDMGSRMIISGSDNNNFEPDRDITRAEFATIIIRGLGIKSETGNSTFIDVNSTDWYFPYIEAATEYGIVTGYGNGKFGPNDKITREQAMAMIARTMKITGLEIDSVSVEAKELLSSFRDFAESSNWARDSIYECVKAGIVTGKSGSNLAPLDEITRAEVAVIIQRLLQKSDLI